MKREVRHKLTNSMRELPRYFTVCIVSFSSDYATLYTMTEYFHWHYLYSALLGFLVGNIVNYLLATRLVFSHRKLNSKYSESFIYIVIAFLVLPIHHGVLWLCTESFGIIYQVSKLFASGTVFFVIFLLRKFFLF